MMSIKRYRMDGAGGIIEDTSGAWVKYEDVKPLLIYPFEEGEDYYIIDKDKGVIIWSCWDSISEELHTDDKIYFRSLESTLTYARENGIVIYKIYDHE